MDLSRIVVVTGVTRGIGRALAFRLAALGHTVCGCGRSHADAEALQRALAPPHRIERVDVSCAGQVDAWAGAVLSAVGAPDLVINNAGVINRSATLWTIGADEFSRVLGINVGGTANVIRAFLPAMIRRGRGVVVNMSSGWGRSASPEVAPYCASKWAVEGLTRALALELPPGLAAVAVNPGIIDTEMLRTCWGEAAGEFYGPEAWAEAAAPFLLGLSARDNGASLSVG
jgi:NAD(P)-dependent dehydrogenase (short-subunit alcohol dehydrogenase family)